MRIAIALAALFFPFDSPPLAQGRQDPAKPEEPKIERGEKAPAFVAKNQKGDEVKLEDFKDKKNVLLAFYPRDFTPG